MSEKVIGSIYPAALIGRTPLFGNIYMPYRLIFTSERVVAFYPDAKKTFRSGLKLFKTHEYRSAKWKKMLEEIKDGKIVYDGDEGVTSNMLSVGSEQGYGSMAYDKIGCVLLKPGADEAEFNMQFGPSEKILMRGLEFCTARSVLTDVKALLEKTPLSGKLDSKI